MQVINSRNGARHEAWLTRLRRVGRRHPLLCCALACVAAIIAARHGAGWAAGVIACLGYLSGWLWGKHAALLGVGCAVVAALGFSLRSRHLQRAEQSLPGQHGYVQAVLLEDAGTNGRYWTAAARMREGGVCVWWKGGGEPPVAGSTVAASGRWEAVPPPRNEGEFDRAAWFRRRGIAAVFVAESGQQVDVGTLARGSAWWRHGFREAVTSGLTPDSRAARTIRAVVIGEHPENDDALVAAFRDSGSLHVFSVSGLHVMMMAGMAWWLLRRLRLSRRAAVLVLIPFMFGYAWITGNSAPAVRAAWMGAIFLGAFAFRRQPNMLNALGGVLLAAVLWDARLLLQPGVQLSYGVVAVIGIGSAWLAERGAGFAKPDDYLPESLLTDWQRRWLNARRWLVRATATSIAAFVGSTPLTLWHFGLVTPVSIPANLFLAPSVGSLLALSLVSAGIRPLAPGGSDRLNQANAWVAEAAFLTAEFFAGVPAGHANVRHESGSALRVFALDHGANAACFSTKRGAVLIDVGDRFGFRRTVFPALRHFGIEPDSAAFTHADGMHVGNAGDVLAAWPIRQVLLPVESSRSANYRSWQAAAVEKVSAVPGQRLALGDGRELEVLLAPPPDSARAAADDRVAIFRLHWDGWKILFLSDAGLATVRQLLGRDCAADVVVCGSHMSGRGWWDDDVFAAIAPRAIIASHADFPANERLAPEVVSAWRARGIAVFHQGECGGVTVTAEPAGLRLQGFLESGNVLLERTQDLKK